MFTLAEVNIDDDEVEDDTAEEDGGSEKNIHTLRVLFTLRLTPMAWIMTKWQEN
jgi:hypothetical protein